PAASVEALNASLKEAAIREVLQATGGTSGAVTTTTGTVGKVTGAVGQVVPGTTVGLTGAVTGAVGGLTSVPVVTPPPAS
ncbi:MAG: hypothetical protein DME03_20910, partial [Candidatus Rokuibacteriota bacterium]